MSKEPTYHVRYETSTMVWVTFEFEGFHKYKDADDEVSYLRKRHRHIFKVRAEVEVFHDDREIEFISLKNFLQRYSNHVNLNNKSCEMLCDIFADAIIEKYKLAELYDTLGKKTRRIMIEVSEDGENGAYKIYHPSIIKEMA